MDNDDLVGLWDSGPFEYGAMEASQLGLLSDGTGWSAWSNVAGGMELTLLTWRRLDTRTLEIVERTLHSGSWKAGYPDQILTEDPPTLLDTTTRYRYEVARKRAPVDDRPVRALTFDKPLQLATEYAFVRHTVRDADIPRIVHAEKD